MPWKECHVVDERLRFVARLLDGENMTTVQPPRLFGTHQAKPWTRRDLVHGDVA